MTILLVPVLLTAKVAEEGASDVTLAPRFRVRSGPDTAAFLSSLVSPYTPPPLGAAGLPHPMRSER
jgi:hypothetical protein